MSKIWSLVSTLSNTSQIVPFGSQTTDPAYFFGTGRHNLEKWLLRMVNVWIFPKLLLRWRQAKQLLLPNLADLLSPKIVDVVL